MAKFRLSFNSVLWLATAVILVGLFGWPLAKNVWAEFRWNQTPCHVYADKNSFVYQVDGTHYRSLEIDLWVTNANTSVLNDFGSDLEDNGICWVNPRNPFDAVLYLDAPTNWGKSVGRLAGSAVLIAAVAVVTLLGPRVGRKRNPNGWAQASRLIGDASSR